MDPIGVPLIKSFISARLLRSVLTFSDRESPDFLILGVQARILSVVELIPTSYFILCFLCTKLSHSYASFASDIWTLRLLVDTWYTNTTIYTVFHEQMVIERPQSNQAFIRALCHHAFFTMNLGKSAGDWNPNEAVVRWYVKIFLCARWWFYIFLMFILSWRDDPFWLICFKDHTYSCMIYFTYMNGWFLWLTHVGKSTSPMHGKWEMGLTIN